MCDWYNKRPVTERAALIGGVCVIIGSFITGIFDTAKPSNNSVIYEQEKPTIEITLAKTATDMIALVPTLELTNSITLTIDSSAMRTPTPAPTLEITPIPTQEAPNSPSVDEYCANFQDIRVRVGPGINTIQTAILTYGECLLFDARTSDGNWMRISKNQGEKSGGWVSSDQLKSKMIDILPIISPSQLYCRIYKIDNYLNVRDGPGSEVIIGYLHDGNILQFDGRSQDGTWIRITDDQEPYGFNNGWISSKYAFPFNINTNAEWSLTLFSDLPEVLP